MIDSLTISEFIPCVALARTRARERPRARPRSLVEAEDPDGLHHDALDQIRNVQI